jgi:hypothetical protein
MEMVVSIILLTMGLDIIRERAGWGCMLNYVVAFHFATMGIQGVYAAITSINRFYPQMRRYMTFVQGFTSMDAERHPPITSANSC